MWLRYLYTKIMRICSSKWQMFDIFMGYFSVKKQTHRHCSQFILDYILIYPQETSCPYDIQQTHDHHSSPCEPWVLSTKNHADVIKWKHFTRYWPFVRGIHWSSVNSLPQIQWRTAFMFSLICASINGWVNDREAGGFETPSRPLWRHCITALYVSIWSRSPQ